MSILSTVLGSLLSEILQTPSTIVSLSVFVLVTVILWKLAKPLVKLFVRTKRLDEIVGAAPRHWFFGHLKKYPPTHDGILRGSRERPASFPLMFNFWIAPCFSFLHTYHPDSAIALLSSGAPKNNVGYRFVRPWIGDGLLTSKGKKWQRNRHLLTPAFHFKILKGYVEIFNKTSKEMLDKWENLGNGPIEISVDVGLMTLDTMLQCAMSVETNCQQLSENHPYIKAVEDLASLITLRINKPLYLIDFIFWNSKAGKRFKEAAKIVHKEAENIIRSRKQELKQKMLWNNRIHSDKQTNDSDCSSDEDNDGTPKRKLFDFLDTLIHTKDEEGNGLTDREIRDEVDTFLFEGHDTTSSGIQWTLYNLAKYPEYQEKCRKEVNEVLGDKQSVEWDDLAKFSYLTMFIKEDMRLYPPVVTVSRELVEPLTVKSKLALMKEAIIPTGSTVSLHIFTLHRNPHVWENPHVFDPERFTKENIAKRSPHAYLPFSAGSRNCIGQNFAMNEMKITIAQTLRRFRLYLDNDTPEPKMAPRLILQSKNGIHIKFEKL
uniref:Leukotriene-B4 omega-hydroxylase 3-like n=1 Tax=Phallusia mammillata TaxID=59560 RepID=A0A6F9D9R6_9ASCI|nr:leukotriene-B4 omega-hydroxylase 3-like [Phallusia mammillata]